MTHSAVTGAEALFQLLCKRGPMLFLPRSLVTIGENTKAPSLVGARCLCVAPGVRRKKSKACEPMIPWESRRLSEALGHKLVSSRAPERLPLQRWHRTRLAEGPRNTTNDECLRE